MSNPLHRSVRPLLLAAVLALALSACGGNQNRYQGLSPDELLRIAQTEHGEGDLDNAILALDRILLNHGDWENVPETRLMLGDLYFEKEEYLTARSEYNRFLDRYPGHARAPDAALGVCRSLAQLAPVPQRDQTYTQQAITACRNVVIDFAGMDQSSEAARISNELRHTLAEKEYLNAQFYERRELWDAAIKYYEFVINLYPESELVPAALLGVYRANTAIGYDDLAQEARERLLTEFPDSQAAEEIRTNGETTDGQTGEQVGG